MVGHHSHKHADDWDGNAEAYVEMLDVMEPELAKATDALLDAVRAHSGTRLLDLACGPGHTTAAATARNAHATGVDASAAMIVIAKRLFPAAQFLQGDMLEPPAGPWDAVTCRMGAHHVNPDWLRAAYDVMRPGGRLAIAETGAPDDAARSRDMRQPDEWVHLLQAAGFVSVEWSQSGADFSKIAAAGLTTAVGDAGDDTHVPPSGPIYIIAGVKPGAPT